MSSLLCRWELKQAYNYRFFMETIWKLVFSKVADETEFAEKPECHHEYLQNNLNADLPKISDYLNFNRLSLNIPKC